MFDPQLFAKNIRNFRKTQKLRQSELAQRLSVSPQSVSKWERGESVPDMANLCALAECLNTSLDVLLGVGGAGEEFFIGVDGGGTKTEFLLVTAAGVPRKRVVLGGSNPNMYGVEEACRIFRTGIDALAEPSERIRGIFIGGAGLAGKENRKQVLRTLQESYPRCTIKCDTDICNVFACSEREGPCLAAICGTGSIVWSLDGETMLRTGGAGTLLEKAGSGYDLGRDALHIALQQRDGSGPASQITPLVERRLNGTVWEKLPELYQKETGYIASFAECVFQAAEKKDQTAIELIRSNAQRLSLLIRTGATKAPRCRHVVFAGGVVIKQPLFRQFLLESLPSGLTTEFLTVPPVWGACRRAVEECGMQWTANREEFLREYEILCAKENGKGTL